jgi:hypothetical protein
VCQTRNGIITYSPIRDRRSFVENATMKSRDSLILRNQSQNKISMAFLLIVALSVIEGGLFGTLDNSSHSVYMPHRDIEAGAEVYVCSYGGLCTYGIVTDEGNTDLVGAVGGGIRKMLLGVDTKMFPELELIILDELPDGFYVKAKPVG